MAASKPPRPPLNQPGDAQPASLADNLMISTQVLNLFQISTRTLQTWRTKGILPYCKIGNNIYYFKSDVEELLRTSRKVKDK